MDRHPGEIDMGVATVGHSWFYAIQELVAEKICRCSSRSSNGESHAANVKIGHWRYSGSVAGASMAKGF